MPAGSPLPSAALDDAALAAASDELVATLRALIRIPSINPPPPDGPDGETGPLAWIADALARRRPPPEVLEPVPGRGSVSPGFAATVRAAIPCSCLHLDVVPAPPDLWTHDPFAGDLADGYVWGRGAVDMKNLLAMELRRPDARRRGPRSRPRPRGRPRSGPDARRASSQSPPTRRPAA